MTTTTKTSTTNALDPGTYLIGDPCYSFDNALPHEVWMEWLDSANYRDEQHILDGSVKGMRIVASSTQHGDGTYSDQDGFMYDVDAGLLGAVRIEFLETLYPSLVGMDRTELEATTGMRVVEFPTPFHIGYDDGTITIGDIVIETDWFDDDDE